MIGPGSDKNVSAFVNLINITTNIETAALSTASILLLSVIDVSGACPDKWLDASFMEMGCLFFNNTAAVNWEEANVVCKKYSKSTLV